MSNNKFENLDKVGNFLDKYDFPKLTQKETNSEETIVIKKWIIVKKWPMEKHESQTYYRYILLNIQGMGNSNLIKIILRREKERLLPHFMLRG